MQGLSATFIGKYRTKEQQKYLTETANYFGKRANQSKRKEALIELTSNELTTDEDYKKPQQQMVDWEKVYDTFCQWYEDDGSFDDHFKSELQKLIEENTPTNDNSPKGESPDGKLRVAAEKVVEYANKECDVSVELRHRIEQLEKALK